MSIYTCPKGHISTESDYCSECGAKINSTPELTLAANSITPTVPPTVQAVVNCPDCTAPHEPDSGDFCEICGYNFVTGAHGEVPMLVTQESEQLNNPSLNQNPVQVSLSEIPVSRQTSPQRPPQQTQTSPLPQETAVALEIVVTIDPSLQEVESPPPPINQEPISLRLDKESNLIGRRSDIRGIHPEVALDFDDAVSHRHALLNRQSDGTFVLRDIGSTNGTKLNGVELEAMVDVPIKAGDEFTLGHWTRIIVQGT
jgi:hypothetical protein